MIQLDYLLTYGSMLAETAALVVVGLATWKVAKLLREKSFLFAAWAMAFAFVLIGLLVILDLAWDWFPDEVQARFGSAYLILHQIQAAVFLASLGLFAVGAVRCGMRVKKAAL